MHTELSIHLKYCHDIDWGWSGGATVLDKLPVPGRPTYLVIVGQWPTALVVGAGGVVWTFFSIV